MAKKSLVANEIVEKVVEDYLNWSTYPQLAEKYNLSKGQVDTIIRKHPVAKNRGAKRFVPTQEQLTEILDSYKNGIGTTKISKKFNVATSVITRILKENNITIKRVFTSDKEEVHQKVLQMYLDGFTQEEIMKECHIRRDSVNKILTKLYPGYEDKKRKFLRKDEIIDSHGYRRVKLDKDDPYIEMSRLNGYVMKHRYIMAQHLGRALKKKEQVHHIDGDRSNNDISNLQLRSTYHGPGQTYKCNCCGSLDVSPIEI